MGADRAWVLAHPEAELTSQDRNRLNLLLDKLRQGTPLPYLTGIQEFYGRPFRVTPQVLIPRPETECLVETALASSAAGGEQPRILDIGSGSGCIAITLALEIPASVVTAVDLDFDALNVTRDNAVRLGADLRLAVMDLACGLAGPYDLICANLPYIPTDNLDKWEVTRWEPRLALDGGLNGIGLIRRLIHDAPRLVAPGGMLLMEIEYRQAGRIRELAKRVVPRFVCQVRQDLAGNDRVIILQNPAR